MDEMVGGAANCVCASYHAREMHARYWLKEPAGQPVTALETGHDERKSNKDEDELQRPRTTEC